MMTLKTSTRTAPARCLPSKRWGDLQGFHARVKVPSLDALDLTFNDTALDDDVLIKLAGITRALPPVSTFVGRLGNELDQFADTRIRHKGSEPGGLDDLLDKISATRRKVSDKANKALHADKIKARDVARYEQNPTRRASVIKTVEEWRAIPENRIAEQLRSIERTAVDYHRPFVIIDSEGCNREGHDITRGGITYPDHGTFLWAAMPWLRDSIGTGKQGSFGERWQ